MQRALIFCILSSGISFGDNYLAVIEDFSERGSRAPRRANVVARVTARL
jgi:hypothetical protein